MKALFFKILIPLALLVSSAGTQAADSWTTRTINGTKTAITPLHKLQVIQLPNPTETVWGQISVPIKAEQLPELEKHFKTPNFPFIDVGVDVDGYYRTAQGHIHRDVLLITVEFDRRHWDGMESGRQLTISLPDKTVIKEVLRGSRDALRAIDKR